MRVEMFTFLLAGAICLAGALGVVLFRNPVHNALSLVATLFGVAVLFIAQGAYFLAAIQVIVYAGAIVVLFLFVLMLLGVDRTESAQRDPIAGQRLAAVVIGLAVLGLSVTVLVAGGKAHVTGEHSVVGTLGGGMADINRLGRVLFTDYVFAVEITAVLLTVAVIGAVVLSRRPSGPPIDVDEFPDGPAVEPVPLFDDGPEAASIGSDDGPEAIFDEVPSPVVEGGIGSGGPADEASADRSDDESADAEVAP